MRITLNDLPTSMTKKMADRTTFDSAMPLYIFCNYITDNLFIIFTFLKKISKG